MGLLTRPRRRRGCLGCLLWSAPVALLSLVALLFVAAELLRFGVAALAAPYAPSPWRLALSLAVLAIIQIAPRAWSAWRRRQAVSPGQAPQERAAAGGAGDVTRL